MKCFSGEESMREISVKYNVKKSTLSRLIQSDRTIDRTGRRTSIFTTEEESVIERDFKKLCF